MRLPEQRGLKMTLGNQPPFAMPSAETFCTANYNGSCITSYDVGKPLWWSYWPRHFPVPWERFRERIKTRNRYRPGPKPWWPGRHNSSRWQPYTGIGRFSGLGGKYHGARYRPPVSSQDGEGG